MLALHVALLKENCPKQSDRVHVPSSDLDPLHPVRH